MINPASVAGFFACGGGGLHLRPMGDPRSRLDTALSGLYRIERELGRGGMATVYLAEDIKHRRRVAVKVVKPEIAHALGSERFLREIEIAARLAHPNILPLYDSGEADGVLYYAMPYVEGESLRDRLDREKQLPLQDALRITREVAAALTYAHSKGVVHRDIKPENVLLQSGQAVVSDFGIARAVGKAGGDRLTESGLAVGTPTYMSPEQASGEQDIDARSDIYSLGCLLYEMLAGSPPYMGANAQAILARKVSDPVPGLRVVRDTVPVAIENVITRALAKAPADRFATAAQFAEALDNAATSPSGLVTRRRVWTQGRVLAVGAAVAVLATGAWLISRSFAGGGTARVVSVAVLPFENSSGDSAQEYFVAGMHDALIAELAQIGALRVISRRSVMRYQNSQKSIPEIARELNVDRIVEGTVTKTGDTLRLRVQLIAAEPEERNLFAQAYQANVLNVLGLYGDVARGIARAARVTPTIEEAARLGSARTVNPRTYEAYLRGMFYLNKPDRREGDNIARGLAYLHQAVENDPGDPYAYAGLSLGYATLGHGPNADMDSWPRARAAAIRAVTLDSTLAEARAALAEVKLYYEWDWAGAEREFRRALELNPGLAMAHYHYAWYHALFERWDDAITEHKRAQELDPFTAGHTAWLGALYNSTGRYDEAIAEARKALVLTPDFPPALIVLGRGYLGKGMQQEAIATHERLAELRPVWKWVLGRTYARTGRGTDARRILDELEAAEPSPFLAYGLIQLAADLGEKDKAFRWAAYEPPHAFFPWIASSSDLASLHTDARFATVRERLKLPM